MASPTPRPPKQTWRNFSGINLFTHDSILGKGKHAWCPLMSSSLPPPPGTRTPTPSMWTPRGSQPGSKATQRPSPTPAKAATPTAHHTGHLGLPSPGRTKRRSPGKVSNALFTRTVAVRTDGTAGAWEGLVGVGSSARSGPGQYPHVAPTSSCPGWGSDPTLPTCHQLLFWQNKKPNPKPSKQLHENKVNIRN